MYYEAIIQLRPYNEEVINFIRKKVEERRNVFITKEINLKTGIDFYLTCQRFARALGQKLKRTFNGELKTSRSLYGIRKGTSKKVYRVTVLFRLK